MPESSNTNQESVRKQLDEILAKEIIAFIDADSDMVMMSFNLATICCIIISVDREREMKAYADAPPERFNHETFTSELVDIGLDQDDYLENAISNVLASGYVTKLPNGDFKAEMPAFMMVGFLDSMFPGMQGLNLIAFILQINEEVNSGRKDLDYAKKSFETTLKTRGVAVTKDRAKKRATEMVKGVHKAVTVQSKQISAQLKREKLNKLSQLIKSRKQRTDGYQEKLKIKTLFEIEAEKKDAKEREEAALKTEELAKELAEKEKKIQETEIAAQKLAEQLQGIEEKEKAAEEARANALAAQQKAEALAAREQEIAEKESRLLALEEEFKRREEDIKEEAKAKELAEKEAEVKEQQAEKTKAQDDIKSRIADFEQTLTMPCPLCDNGSIEEKTTDKGKVFYSCTDADCRFVSWDKPYHFECPMCKNPYLIEFTTPSGTLGLRCPRISCTYSQDNLLPPVKNMEAATGPAPKKKKLVRRVKRRR